MRKISLGCIFVLCSLALALPVEAQKIDLSLKLQKGHTYTHEMVSTASIKQQLEEMDFDVEMQISGTMSFLVKETGPDGYLMDVQYERMAMRLSIPMAEEMVFDSDAKDPEDIFSRIMGKIVRQPFGVRMSKSGKVQEILEIERMFDAMFDQFSEIPEEQLHQIKDQLLDAYGAKAFKGSLEMLTAIFPEKNVAIGEKWSVQTNLMGMMEAQIDATFQLDQSTKDFNLITGKALINTNPVTEMEDGDITMDLEGTMLSNIKVDPTTGWVIAASINQHIEGNSMIGPSEDMSEGMSIPITLITKIEIKGK